MVRVAPPALRASLALLGAAALLGGCAVRGPEPVRERGATIHLRLDEYSITPASIKVRAGRIRIVARNVGRLTHNVKVLEDTDEEGADPIVYGGTATMHGGDPPRSVTLTLLPGHYLLVCTIGSHKNLGQYASLQVTEAAP